MPPLLGMTLEEARTSWFFEWFHLQPTEMERPGEGRLVRFLPRGGAFRDVVALDADLDDSGQIRTLSLGLDRRFIDEPADAGWARDIAQAFLRAAVPGPADAVVELAEEIGSASAQDELPKSEPAEAFLGDRAECRLDAGRATVTLRNVDIGSEHWLVITAVLARGTGPAPAPDVDL